MFRRYSKCKGEIRLIFDILLTKSEKVIFVKRKILISYDFMFFPFLLMMTFLHSILCKKNSPTMWKTIHHDESIIRLKNNTLMLLRTLRFQVITEKMISLSEKLRQIKSFVSGIVWFLFLQRKGRKSYCACIIKA